MQACPRLRTANWRCLLIKASLVRQAIRNAILRSITSRGKTTTMDGKSASPAGAVSVVPAAIRRDPGELLYEPLGALVERIRSGKTDGLEELQLLFSRGIRFYLRRQLGPRQLDANVRDALDAVVQGIRRGELPTPAELNGYVQTILRRLVAARIDRVPNARRDQMDLESTTRIADWANNAPATVMLRQRAEQVEWLLDELPARDREILTRFYLREQTEDQICSEMAVSGTQFRLVKASTKTTIEESCNKKHWLVSLRMYFS
jgi:RNA polymerase sigma-70 factor (ECF subfamily)